MKPKARVKAPKKSVKRRAEPKKVEPKRVAKAQGPKKISTERQAAVKTQAAPMAPSAPPNPFIEAMKKERERERSAFAQRQGPKSQKFRRGQFSGFGGRRAA